jgi:glutathione synthase/RimK-type ligase-like ATP-grasp enzyme
MIAIHNRQESFSDKWIEFCRNKNLEYKIVDCYSSNILSDLKDCKALMWHWSHNDYKAQMFARQLIFAIELGGISVFPDIRTCLHFDDKIAQKYLMESIGAPFVETHAVYDKAAAFNLLEDSIFPLVFKLKGGAGSANVRLIKDKETFKTLVNKSFGKGFKPNSFSNLAHKLSVFRKVKSVENFGILVKGLGRVFYPNRILKKQPIQKDYFYIQEFIPDNDCDIRVVIIGKRAFAIKRFVRENDFRASGSGDISYEKSEIPLECIKIGFEVSNKLGLQCAAYDFVLKNNEPLIIEVSYGFKRDGYLDCQGYWDEELNWYKGAFTPEYFMIEDMLKVISKDKS